jgi:hypothetical protein
MNPNIKPPNVRGRLKWLIYGHPGYQKTRFVGTCGEVGKTLLLRPPTDTTSSIVGTPNVYEWVITDHSMLEDAYQEVRGSKEWTWVWLDSISQWQDTGLDDIWETVVQERPARGRYGLDQGEYGINMWRIAGWVRHMAAQADAGYFNFGITAHTRELSAFEDSTGREVQMPWIQGKNMASKICGYMHIVGYLDQTTKGTPILLTEAGPRYYAIDRFHSVPDGKMLRPTARKLMEVILKTNERKPAAKPKAAGKTIIIKR